MTRRIMFLLTAVMLAVVSPLLSAHDEFRIVGVVASREASQVVVKTREGNRVSMAMNKQTKVTRDKKNVDASEVKVGVTVVADAYGDSEADLLALVIQIVPPIPAKK
jgi:hypothetical protein